MPEIRAPKAETVEVADGTVEIPTIMLVGRDADKRLPVRVISVTTASEGDIANEPELIAGSSRPGTETQGTPTKGSALGREIAMSRAKKRTRKRKIPM